MRSAPVPRVDGFSIVLFAKVIKQQILKREEEVTWCFSGITRSPES